MTVRTPIIPIQPIFVGQQQTLDHEAICVFMALGFFLDDDTYYKEQKILLPAREYEIKNENVQMQQHYFKWHYTPIERTFDEVVEEFGDLFETIIKEQTEGKKVILPLSGGLDSRTQAVALSRLNVSTQAYSYSFEGGHDETWYGHQIAHVCNFPFEAMKVPEGYLWDCIEQLARLNGCYSEFTHPRQMAFIDQYARYGEVFSLGHWGDVLFDDMGVADDLSLDGQVAVLFKKVVKKSGLELANRLWETWDLQGDFTSYLKQRLYDLLVQVNIPHNANAQIRAFKSLYWAPRWTSINLSVFESVRPITLPYFDNRMCEFICSVPERYLAGRQIQIAYIKNRMPEVAKVAWQAQRPFNLYSYHYNKLPWNLPYRVINKTQRIIASKPYIQRNFELQFLGASNDAHLKTWLFEHSNFDTLVPKTIAKEFYDAFYKSDSVTYAHAVSMLLVLSLFSKTKSVVLH